MAYDISKFDAGAVAPLGLPCIAINYGAVLVVYDTFYRMLSHPAVLPQIGNASAEDRRPELVYPLFDDFAPIRGRRADFRAVIPKDKARELHAELLAMIALDFLGAHELAHICLGHCGYDRANSGPRLLRERGRSASGVGSSTSPLVDQAMEIEADLLAMRLTTRGYLDHAPEGYGSIRARQEQLVTSRRPPIHDTEALMGDCLFAFNVFWSLLGYAKGLDNMETDDHPSCLLRSFSAIPLLGHLFPQDWPYRQERINDLIYANYDRAMEAMHAIGGEDNPVEAELALRPEVGPILTAHLKKLEEEWKGKGAEVHRHSYLQHPKFSVVSQGYCGPSNSILS